MAENVRTYTAHKSGYNIRYLSAIENDYVYSAWVQPWTKRSALAQGKLQYLSVPTFSVWAVATVSNITDKSNLFTKANYYMVYIKWYGKFDQSLHLFIVE